MNRLLGVASRWRWYLILLVTGLYASAAAGTAFGWVAVAGLYFAATDARKRA